MSKEKVRRDYLAERANKDYWVSGDYSLWLVGYQKDSPIVIHLRKAEFLEMRFHGGEWAQLFYGVLGCPTADKYESGEELKVWLQRNEKKFRKAIPNYPMLSELNDIYSDILFKPKHTKKLLKEILEIIPKASENKVALEGLKKLKLACKKAIEKDKILYLS